MTSNETRNAKRRLLHASRRVQIFTLHLAHKATTSYGVSAFDVRRLAKLIERRINAEYDLERRFERGIGIDVNISWPDGTNT